MRAPTSPSSPTSQLALVGLESAVFDEAGRNFCANHSATERRHLGATFTPEWLVRLMLTRCAALALVDVVVDPGCGSGRFGLAAAGVWPRATVVGVEVQPELAALARAAWMQCGLGARAQVDARDFLDIERPPGAGRIAFVGNPPYVRHHQIEARHKAWYQREMTALGIRASALAGLHAHFLLKTALLARPGDSFCFVLPAEWLDTRYGQAVRSLLVSERLAVAEMWLADRARPVFDDAMTSSIVVAGRVGAVSDTVTLGTLAPDGLGEARVLPRQRLLDAPRWSPLWHADGADADLHGVEVGEVFSVRRGQVTGANGVWIHGIGYGHALPDAVLRPAITRARELLALDEPVIEDADALKRVIDLPEDWEAVHRGRAASQIAAFLHWAREHGGQDGYIARHRRPWYRVNLGPPAPIVMTYMARRAPRFVLNRAGVGILNIAHGLFPRAAITERQLMRAVEALNLASSIRAGRSYAGNLVKFEPSDAMRMRFAWREGPL